MQKLKKLITPFVVFALSICLLMLPAFAASGSVNGLSIATSGSTGSISTGTNSATLTVEKSRGLSAGTASDTFTFTNPSSNAATVKVSFDYEFDGTSYTISGVTENTGSKCNVTLNPGGSFSVYMTAYAGRLAKTTSTFTITNLTVTEVMDGASVTVVFNSNLGSVTADGTTVSNGEVLTVGSNGVEVKATADSGTFLAWIDGSGKVLSRNASFTYQPTESIATLHAVFADTTPWFYVDNADYLVEGWEKAMTHSGTVVLANDATLSEGTYTVPSSVTLLIPYDAGFTCKVETPEVKTPASKEATPTANRTLTLEKGAHITVNGTMTVPAAVRAGNTTTGYAATMVKGTYGHVAMNSGSSITVKADAKLSVYGYITGSGSVVAESGATVYEAFQVMGFRGGSATSSMATSKKAFPISQYYVQNIEAPLTLYSGAVEYAYVALYMSSEVIDSSVAYIGQSGCMFNLTSGYLIKQYDKTNDRQQIDFYGNLTVSKFTIDIKYIITYSIDSSNFVCPITNNMTVNIHDGSTVTIGANMSMLPGSEINIDKGGTLTLASGKSLYLYDLDEWSGKSYVYSSRDMAALCFAPNRTKTRTASDLKDAQITVAGTLNAFAGNLYTSNGGAAIKGEEGGQVLITSASSTVDRQATQSGTSISYDEITMNSASLLNSDNTYYVNGSGTYTYVSGYWHGPDCDGSTTTTTVAATCESDGYTEIQCSCGVIYEKTTTAALGHTEVTDAAVAATCVDTGLTAGSHCSACGETIVAQKVIPAVDHETDGCIHVAKIGSNYYETLAAAVTAYGDAGYIQMIADSVEDNYAIAKTVYLDLNGCDVSGVSVASGGTLYGMDSKTDGYESGKEGSITLSSGTVAPVTDFDGKNTTEGSYTVNTHRYLAVKAENVDSWSFHRYNLSVGEAYYLEVLSNNTAKIGVSAYFRGNSTVRAKMSEMGFSFDKATPVTTALSNPADPYTLYYTSGAATMTAADLTLRVRAAVLFSTDTNYYYSNSWTVDFVTLLQTYYQDADANAKAILESFATVAGIQLT